MSLQKGLKEAIRWALLSIPLSGSLFLCHVVLEMVSISEESIFNSLIWESISVSEKEVETPKEVVEVFQFPYLGVYFCVE